MPTPPPPPAVTLTLHGPPTIAGQPLERKDAAWLALLALDGPAPRNRLAAWLWPEAPAKTAAGSLRQRIFRLRQRTGQRLVDAGEQVLLRPEVVLAPADGELLAGCEYDDCAEVADWLRRRRGLERAARVEALTAAAARHEAAGELGPALERVHALLALEPLSEHAHRLLMRLHYLRGDRAAAITAFERFERALREELGADPSAETVALLATIERSSAAPVLPHAGVPVALQRPPRLVGRRRELGELAAARAAGRVFFLLGEAGMGKTRLLAELAHARPGRVLRVAARPGDAGVPFALLARLLRAVRADGHALADDGTRRELARVLPELGATAAAGELQRLALQRAVERQLEALGEAELWVDDLHFADGATLEMLQALLAAGALPRLGWGFAQRPAEGVPAAQALRDGLAEAQRLHELPLAPLDHEALADLVASLALPGLDPAALAPALWRHTGGNPMYALETLKDLLLHPERGGTLLPQPASVGALIERRLKALSPPALALARVAAVAGDDFGIELAEAVLQTSALALADAWAELQTAQVLAGPAFAHDLVHDATLRTLPPEIARHVHGRVADALQRGAAPPARIARHAASAWRWADAALHFERAAEAARRAGRPQEAAAFLGDAWGCCERLAGRQDEALRLRAAQVDALIEAEYWVEAIAAAEALLGCEAAPAGRALALRLHAKALFCAGRYDEAAAAGTRAEAAARETGDSDLIGRAAHIGAMATLWHDPHQAGDRMVALLPWAATLPDARERREIERDAGMALFHAHRAREALVLLQACAAQSEAAGDVTELGNVAMVLGMCRSRLGDNPGAIAELRRAVAARHASTVGDEDHGAPASAIVLASLLRCQGHFDEALAGLEAARRRLAAVDSEVVERVDAELGLAWLWLGQAHRARQALQSLQARAQDGLVQGLGASLALELTLWEQGDATAALARFAAACGASGDLLDALESQWRQAAAVPGSAEPLARIAAQAADAGFVRLARSVEVSRAERLRLDGQPQAAAQAALAVVGQIAGGLNGDHYPPQAWLQCIDALQAGGEWTAALVALADARRWVVELALPHVAEPFRDSFLARNPFNRRLLALRLAG